MPWWGWILVGTLLLAAELFVVQADFYLVFLGFSALVVGTLEPRRPRRAALDAVADLRGGGRQLDGLLPPPRLPAAPPARGAR